MRFVWGIVTGALRAIADGAGIPKVVRISHGIETPSFFAVAVDFLRDLTYEHVVRGRAWRKEC